MIVHWRTTIKSCVQRNLQRQSSLDPFTEKWCIPMVSLAGAYFICSYKALLKSSPQHPQGTFSCLFVCFISFYILPPPHLANFQPRSSMLQKNLFFPLLYTHRHGKLIPVVFTTILQVMNLLRWPPNAFLFFFFPSRFRYYSLKKEDLNMQ